MNGEQNCGNREYDNLCAGDTLKWRRTLRAYPSNAGWFLSYSVLGCSQTINFQSTPSQDGYSHIVYVPASVTALWLPSDIAELEGWAILPPNSAPGNADEIRHQIYDQAFPIRPNNQVAQPDQPTSLQKLQTTIALLWDLYTNNATQDIIDAHVGDGRFKFESKNDLLNQIYILEARERSMVDAQRAANGKPSRRRLTPRVNITPIWTVGAQWPIPNG